jgi:type I restriction enzyme M protein
VVDDKWFTAINTAVHWQVDRVSQELTHRVTELAERYEMPLPKLTSHATELQAKVDRHLERMGIVWR